MKKHLLSLLLIPLLISPSKAQETRPYQASDFWSDAQAIFRLTYYGRDRDNHAAYGSKSGELNVNALGLGLDFKSGYAWGTVGFDASFAANLGHGDGNSEILEFDNNTGEGSSSASIREAALKLKFGNENQAFHLRGGYTPIRIGTIGTSGGINPHSYRGFEAKWKTPTFELGYGWADQFHNDWDDRFRDMTNRWHQNRDGYNDGEPIDYIHSIGARYNFGPQKNAFIDLGIGEGKDFRKNAQIAASYPITLKDQSTLTLTGYYIRGKYQEELASYITEDPTSEYHFSASAKYDKGPWTFLLGYGQTKAPDGQEMQFRLTPWANSDNRNFIQTWAQLDDFVWDGQKVIKASAILDLSQMAYPGLRVGISYNYGWDINSYDELGTISSHEFDLLLEYVPQSGSLKGWAFGIYPAWLRFEDDNFYGKHSRNDIKFVASYSTSLDLQKIFAKKR